MKTTQRLLTAAKDSWADYNEHPFYGEWVRGYSDLHYSEANVLLLDTLNELTVNYDEKQLQHLADIFVACSRYELAFWDLAWNMSK